MMQYGNSQPGYPPPPPPPGAPPGYHPQGPQYGGNMQYGNNMMMMNNNQFGGQNAYAAQQQPMSFPCCPEDPNTHFCITDPMPQPGQMPSALACLWQFCDGTTWLVAFFFFMSVLGFALTVGIKSPDNLLDKFGAADAADLDNKVYWLIPLHVAEYEAYLALNTTVAPTTPTTTTTKAPTTTTAVSTPPATTTAAPNTTSTSTTTTAPRTAAPGNTSRRQVEDLDDDYPPKIRSKWRVLRSLLQVTTSTAASAPTTPAPLPTAPFVTSTCHSSEALSGTFGNICTEDSLTGTAMLMNQSRWLNFRGALYFLAMLCSGVLLIIIVIVNKQQQFIAAGGQPGMQMPPQQQPMPYQFHGTPLYYSFRIAWGTVAIIVFFWMVTELYQYWWFIGYYIKETSGDLSSFWYWFDRKFVPSTICVGLFLCWPLVHLCLELGLFIVGIIPWYLIRQSCYTQLQTVTVDPEKPFDHHSCCVRTDMFYMGNHQMHRLGFSEGQWTMWTGNKMPFCTMCECQQQQPGQYGGGTYGGGGLSANTSMTAGKPPRPMNSMNMAPSVPPPMGAASRSITGAADMRGSFQTQQSMNLEMQQSSAVFGPQDGGKTPKKSKKDKKDKGEDGDTKKDKKKKKDKSSKSDRESD